MDAGRQMDDRGAPDQCLAPVSGSVEVSDRDLPLLPAFAHRCPEGHTAPAEGSA
jgi:hypothetical protein